MENYYLDILNGSHNPERYFELLEELQYDACSNPRPRGAGRGSVPVIQKS